MRIGTDGALATLGLFVALAIASPSARAQVDESPESEKDRKSVV